MKLLTQELINRFSNVGSQERIKDPIIIAKFFNPCGAGRWYATEYHPEDQTFFGYVTGLACDEWGYFSLIEMQELRLPFGMGIERDLHFGERPISVILNKEAF